MTSNPEKPPQTYNQTHPPLGYFLAKDEISIKKHYYKAINIGTGNPITIKNLTETLTKLYNKPNLKPHMSNEYRKGNIRHYYADTTKTRKLLNFKPTITVAKGLTELAEWTRTHDGTL